MFKTMLETCLLYLSNHICDFSPLKSVSNACFIVLEPLTHKSADLNRLKHSYNSHNTHDLNETLTQASL